MIKEMFKTLIIGGVIGGALFMLGSTVYAKKQAEKAKITEYTTYTDTTEFKPLAPQQSPIALEISGCQIVGTIQPLKES